MWNNMRWLRVTFEIMPKEAVRQNLREKFSFENASMLFCLLVDD